MKLYEISERIRELLDHEELTEEQAQELTELASGLDVKVDSICGIIAETSAEIKGCEAELTRFGEMASVRRNKVKRLKQYLLDCLKNAGQHKHQTKHWCVRVQQSALSAKCTVDPETLPEAFKRVRVEPNLHEAIEQYKKTGQAPEGFELSRSEHLRIS